MYLPYAKCDLGKRCVVKTDDNYGGGESPASTTSNSEEESKNCIN